MTGGLLPAVRDSLFARFVGASQAAVGPDANTREASVGASRSSVSFSHFMEVTGARRLEIAV